MNMGLIFLRNSLHLGTYANSAALRTALLQWCHSSRNFGANPTVSAGNGTRADDDCKSTLSRTAMVKGKGKHQIQKGNRTTSTTNTSSTDINTCKNCGRTGQRAKDCCRPYDNSTSNNSNTQKGKNHKKGKGKSKHVDVVETNQPSETAPTARATINSVSARRQAGAEYLLLDSGAQLHACPITYPKQKVPLPHPGIHTASGARLQPGDIQTSRRTNNSSAFPRVYSSEANSVSWPSRSAGVLE